MRPGDQQHLRAVRRQRAGRHRPGDDARQVQHPHAAQRPRRRRQRLGRRVADALDPHRRVRHGLTLGGGLPTPPRVRNALTHSPAAAAAPRTPAPANRQGSSHRRAVVAAAEQAQHAVAVVREVGVQSHPAIRRPDTARRSRPTGRPVARHRTRNSRLGAELRRGVPHVDGDVLHGAAPRRPQHGGGQPGGSKADLRRGADGEAGRQHGVAPGQMGPRERRAPASPHPARATRGLRSVQSPLGRIQVARCARGDPGTVGMRLPGRPLPGSLGRRISGSRAAPSGPRRPACGRRPGSPSPCGGR